MRIILYFNSRVGSKEGVVIGLIFVGTVAKISHRLKYCRLSLVRTPNDHHYFAGAVVSNFPFSQTNLAVASLSA